MRAGHADDAERALPRAGAVQPRARRPARQPRRASSARPASSPEAVKRTREGRRARARAWPSPGTSSASPIASRASSPRRATPTSARSRSIPNYAAAVLNLGVLDDLYLGDSARALELYTRYLALTPAGDPVVTKWVADVKNRKPRPHGQSPAASAPASAAAPKEKS